MKRKLLPVFLSFALLANGSLTAFATDSSVDTVTESDAQTTVSEDQENPEETTQEELSKDQADPADESDAITDFETAYKAYTFGANVSGPDAISADKNTVAVLDVRSSVNYDISHLEGSFSTPVFNEDGSIIQTSEDATAKAFTKTVTNNANFQNKELYLLCNSGARGARAAAVLLRRCLFDCGRAGSWIKITFTLRVFFCMIGYSVKAEIPLCRRHLWWKGSWQKQRQQIGSKMEFEHYIQQGQQKLRCGYTTGTCAALAGKAAVRMLLSGQKTEEISVLTPKGLWVTTAVEEIQSGDGWVSCGVRKDAGDDIDVTAQSLICVKAKKTAGTKIVIDGGIGVGRVTKPGLEQPVGAAAINSVPRRMILQEAEAECLDAGYEGGLLLTVFVPDGEALAKKTFKPQLGYQGGISILGTTGIVEPKSVQALVDTIGLEIRQRRALGEDALLLTPGNYGMEFLKDRPEFASMTPVQCSNYIGEAFDFAVSSGFSKVILVGHIGKLVKLAGGIMNTHSRVADCRCELFAAHAALAGVSRDVIGRLMEAATTDACLEILDEEGKKETVMQSLMKKIGQHAAHRLGGTVEVTVLVFSNRFGVLGETQCQEI